MKAKVIAFRILVLFLVTIQTTLFAQTVSIEKARDIAGNFYESHSVVSKKIMMQGEVVFSAEKVAVDETDTLFYAFNVASEKGFVIISGDKKARPIIAYSFEGNYPMEQGQISPALAEWMQKYTSEIKEIKKSDVDQTGQVKAQWEYYSREHQPQTSKSIVGPLLTSTWRQGQYYNAQCPEDVDGPDGHALVGCVATAMAQVMNYHQHPLTGEGSHSYTHPDYGTLSADFGSTTYDWSVIPDNANGYNDALALVNYHCGVSVEMQYGPDGSGAYTHFVDNALKSYFKYGSTTDYQAKQNYTEEQWNTLLQDELLNGRPVIYRGRDSQQNAGHAFVCDGYDDSNDGYYHFNWGWGGYADGYFYLDNLNSGGYNWSDDQAAIFGIEPEGQIPAPTNLTGTTGDGYAELSWTAADGEFDYYKVYRNDELYGTTTETSFSDYDVMNMESYTYYVVSFDETLGEESNPTNTITLMPYAALLPPLTENFNDENFPPTGWQMTTQATGGWSGWFATEDGSSSYWDIPSHNSRYACANDDLNNNDGSMDYLITPVLNCEGAENLQLAFESFYNGAYSQEAYVEFSIDDNEWQVLYTVEPSDIWGLIILDLNTLIEQQHDILLDTCSNVRFAFHADDAGAWASGWAVDNVEIREHYPAPTNLTASIVNTDSVFLQWELPEYDIMPEGYKIYRNEVVIDSSASTEYTDPDLPEGAYTYFVTAFNASNDLESIPGNDTTVIFSTEVSIPDTNFRMVINEHLGYEYPETLNHNPTEEEMAGISVLNGNSRNIESIEGINYLSNVIHLTLDSNNISNVNLLSNLSQLTQLYIKSNSIDDINFVSQLTNLQYLDLKGNEITNVSAVSEITSLIELHLDNNSISDISPLSGLTNLIHFGVGHNSITDISPIEGYENINYLNISHNPVINPEIIGNLTSCSYLDLISVNITDISFLETMVNITDLYLHNNLIVDISVLKNLLYLGAIGLDNNQIHDLSPLKDLYEINVIYLRNNSITDIFPLLDNPGIGNNMYEELYLDNNPLSKEVLEVHIPLLEQRTFAYFSHPDTYDPLAPCYPEPVRYDTTATNIISWSANFDNLENVTYDLYYGNSLDELTIYQQGLTETSSAIEPESGQEYYWRVETIHNYDTLYGGLWNFHTVTLDSPENVTATINQQDNQATITWDAPSNVELYDIIYDDGTPSNATAWNSGYEGNMNAIRFTPQGYPCEIKEASIHIWDGTWPAGSIYNPMEIVVLDDDGPDGLPGTELGVITLTPDGPNWITVDLSNLDITITEGEFYIANRQISTYPDCPPTAIAEGSPQGRSYAFSDGSWGTASYDCFMIRAKVEGPAGEEILGFGDDDISHFNGNYVGHISIKPPSKNEVDLKNNTYFYDNKENNTLAENTPGGYKVYRFPEQDNVNEENWTLLAENVVDTSYIDSEWGDLLQDTYQYAVKAVYGENESEPAFSNALEKGGDSHFTPVWQGNAYQPMTFMISGAALDDIQLEAGDEIGIFDGNKCVGAGTLDHTLDATNHEDYIQITAAKDDGSGNGYTEGNPVVYKVWDSSEELEAGVSNVTFPYDPDYTYETFTSLATTFALLDAQSTLDHQNTYQTGWNMTSFAVEPEENNLQTILQPIIDNGELVKVIDEQGNIIEQMPWGWVNNIGAMSPTEGYYVKVTADNSITTTGAPVTLPYDIPLISGWNMMGYPSMTPQDATGALAGLMDNNILIKVIDEQGNIIENMPWGWVNNIGSFQAGEGYYIKVTEDATLTIEEPATRNGQLPESYKAPLANHFTPVYQGNPYEPMQMVIDATSLNLQQGDELAIFSDGKCVGAAGYNPDKAYQYLAASKDDSQTAEQDGYLEETPVILKVYRKADHTVYHVPYESIEGPSGYEPLQTKIVKATILTTGMDDEQAQTVILYQNKPNPLKDKTIISYYLPESGEVSLSIVNLHGQEQLKLVDQTKKSGLHQVELDGNSLSPGIYLYQLNYKSDHGKQQQLYKKMTIVR